MKEIFSEEQDQINTIKKETVLVPLQKELQIPEDVESTDAKADIGNIIGILADKVADYCADDLHGIEHMIIKDIMAVINCLDKIKKHKYSAVQMNNLNEVIKDTNKEEDNVNHKTEEIIERNKNSQDNLNLKPNRQIDTKKYEDKVKRKNHPKNIKKESISKITEENTNIIQNNSTIVDKKGAWEANERSKQMKIHPNIKMEQT